MAATEPSEAAAPAASTSPVADSAADEAAVRDKVGQVYASYMNADGAAGDFELTPEFQAAWDSAVGPEGAMDYDPFCDCQDYGDFGYTVEEVAVDGDTATARLTLSNFGSQSPKQLTFRRVGGDWLLDDMNDGNDGSLHRSMVEAEPGSYSIDF